MGDSKFLILFVLLGDLKTNSKKIKGKSMMVKMNRQVVALTRRDKLTSLKLTETKDENSTWRGLMGDEKDHSPY